MNGEGEPGSESPGGGAVKPGMQGGGRLGATGGDGDASGPCAAPIDCAQVRLLFDEAPRTLFGAALAAVLAVPFLWPQVDGSALAAWLGIGGAIIAARLALLIRYRRLRPDDSRLCRWRDYFSAGAMLTGLVWGVMSAYVAWAGRMPHQALFLVLLAGTAVMSIPMIAPVLRTYLSYALPALLPPTVVLFARGGEIPTAMGAVLAAAILLLLALARSYNAAIRRALTAAMEKDGFINDLRAVFLSLQAAEKVLSASEEALRRAQEVARVGSWHLDMTTNTLTWSDETHRMFGMPRGTPLTYEAFLDCVHPDDRIFVDGCWTAALAGKPYDIEHRIVVGGRVSWVRERAKVEFDGMGRPLRATGTVQEISEKRAAEAQMRLLKAAIESAADPVIVTDAAGTIIYVNPAFERNTGYAKTEAIGQNPRILRSGRQDDAFYRGLWDTITRGETWAGVFVNKRKDGTLFEEEAVISPIRDARSRIANYVCVKRDVTKERSLEADLRERQKMEAVGKLAGGIAHEFNNMLSVINGYAEMVLRKMKPDDPSASSIEAIREAGDRAASITQELLAFSRKQVISPRPMNINATVSLMKAMLRSIVGEDVSFADSLAPDVWLINADTGQIEQVFLNLVVNARDAMPDGGTIRIETANVMLRESDIPESGSGEPGAYVMLAVTDTGTGMDEATRARIFEPFFTTKETGKGTGLGLAVIYGIVKQSGGHIRVESASGLGTTFKLYFPRLEGGLPVPVPVLVEAAEEAHMGGETILVVDDEEQVVEFVRKVLSLYGYAVLKAGGGEEALGIVNGHPGPIHLLLADAMMPGMNGLELAERIQRIRPGVKVLVISGYAEDVIAHHGILDRGTEFLQKPFTLDSLSLKVRKVLDGN